jgi:hypothetical protein
MYGLLESDAVYLGGEVLMLRSNLLLQSSDYKNHTDAVSRIFQTTIKYQQFTLQGRVQGEGTRDPLAPLESLACANYKNNYL